MTSITEEELKFTFKTGRARKFDEPGIPHPHGWRRVDFIVEEEEITVFIEVKDYAMEALKEKVIKKKVEKLAKHEFVDTQIVPKARDSYCFQYLMNKISKPVVYLVVIGLDKKYYDKTIFSVLKDNINKRLLQEAEKPWEKRYIKECFVLPYYELADIFPNYEVNRI
ncbi:MAG: hypothetical protein H8D42_02040 [Candidatus Marinimicrobia bacterium]|nr:hypothetical protein [Candidatus Neomarinimicrobiota bacterium]MBL7192270.1 hypothetical protein [bacterium]